MTESLSTSTCGDDSIPGFSTSDLAELAATYSIDLAHFYTSSEVGVKVNASRPTVSRWIRIGNLKAVRLGGMRVPRIQGIELLRFIAGKGAN